MPPPFTPDPRAATLAAKLPLPRAVAQLFLVNLQGNDATATASLGTTPWGGVVLDRSNFTSDAQLTALTAELGASLTASGGPKPLLAAAQEGGANVTIPDVGPASEAALGSAATPAQAQTQAHAAGRKLRAIGITMNLAPLADVDIPSGPLSGRLFATDPSTVRQFTVAEVKGYLAAGVIPAVGHFPGSGGASADPDQMTATVGGSLAQLQERDLLPFAAVAAQAPMMLMSNAAYTAFDGVTPASLLPAAVSLLRNRYRFGGVVMSDDLDATLQPTGSDPATVALQALQAGDDLLYITGPPSEHLAAYEGVLEQARRDPVTRGAVRDALLRVLTLKARFGLLPG